MNIEQTKQLEKKAPELLNICRNLYRITEIFLKRVSNSDMVMLADENLSMKDELVGAKEFLFDFDGIDTTPEPKKLWAFEYSMGDLTNCKGKIMAVSCDAAFKTFFGDNPGTSYPEGWGYMRSIDGEPRTECFNTLNMPREVLETIGFVQSRGEKRPLDRYYYRYDCGDNDVRGSGSGYIRAKDAYEAILKITRKGFENRNLNGWAFAVNQKDNWDYEVLGKNNMPSKMAYDLQHPNE